MFIGLIPFFSVGAQVVVEDVQACVDVVTLENGVESKCIPGSLDHRFLW